MDFQVAKLGAGRVALGVVARGEALSPCQGWRLLWRKVESLPGPTEREAPAPHFPGSLPGGKGVIRAPTLLSVHVKSGS